MPREDAPSGVYLVIECEGRRHRQVGKAVMRGSGKRPIERGNREVTFPDLDISEAEIFLFGKWPKPGVQFESVFEVRDRLFGLTQRHMDESGADMAAIHVGIEIDCRMTGTHSQLRLPGPGIARSNQPAVHCASS